jgi:predicted nuclease of predicted toxin-antitoxin system
VKILVDVSAGQAIAAALQALGHDTVSVRDRDPKMADADILAWAVAEKRLVVTMDKDFGELVYHSGQSHSGVLLLRLEAFRTSAKIAIVHDIFQNHADELLACFSVFQNGRLRIR